MTGTIQAKTPLMQQYFDIKAQYPDTLLLFQVGDFYELFFEDAQVAAAFLCITLTARGTNNGEPIPLCGVPIHALDHYLIKLVKGGFRVALCNQLEEATPGKVVRRGVTQVFTPGTLTDEKLLSQKTASYIAFFVPGEQQSAIVFAELLTGQIAGTVIASAHMKDIEAELARFIPDEIVLPGDAASREYETFFKKRGYATTVCSYDVHNDGAAQAWLERHFFVVVQKAIATHLELRTAVYLLYAYINKHQPDALTHVTSLYLYQHDEYVQIDPSTQQTLEIIANNRDRSERHTLFALLDNAVTPMGSRMIKKWLLRPLSKQQTIEQRLDAVACLVASSALRTKIVHALQGVGDCERIVGRIAVGRATVRDCIALGTVLGAVPVIKELLTQAHDVPLLAQIAGQLGACSAVKNIVDAAFDETREDEYKIKKGFDAYLDSVRERAQHGAELILALEQREQHATGINSLKVRYNNVHGYYIEITKTHSNSVPDYYKRQQTLVGKERYMTDELQQLASSIITAQHEIAALERETFAKIKQVLLEYSADLRKCAQALAHLDALVGFALTAYTHRYVRPTFNAERRFAIQAGRHPVVEAVSQRSFIPNDTYLDDEHAVMIITGPNMGGKSTYLRQVALISIMAQSGSFVPARSACLPLLDRIFTRIGAGDNVAEGKSTFLVEMEETAAICQQATERSLVILDEVGRGTSTYDGLAIAQAVVEYIYTHVKARCLFATHYHELHHLTEQYPAIVSYHAASSQTAKGIALLYTIVPGVADGSFGIEVAQLARLPHEVIVRAQELLRDLKQREEHHSVQMYTEHGSELQLVQENAQLRRALHELNEQVAHQRKFMQIMHDINYDELSPKKAFDVLWAYKQQQL